MQNIFYALYDENGKVFSVVEAENRPPSNKRWVRVNAEVSAAIWEKIGQGETVMRENIGNIGRAVGRAKKG